MKWLFPELERRGDPVIPMSQFLVRVARTGAIAFALVMVSLGAGMLGYRLLEHMSWIDAFVNAAMLLGGMGPVGTLQTSGGKLFAGLYALYSGLIVILVAGVMLTPIVHRMLHKFHAAG